MIRHLFKLMWKKKQSGSLLTIEILVSFLILFVMWTWGVFNYTNYWIPRGFQPDQVWVAEVEINPENDSIYKIQKALMNSQLKSYQEIESFCFTSANCPYSSNINGSSIEYQKKKVGTMRMGGDVRYPNTLGIQILEGRWFKDEDSIGGKIPLVITNHLKKELFGNDQGLGKTVKWNDGNGLIVGVVKTFKHMNDFQSDENCAFVLDAPWDNYALIKVKTGVDMDFEIKLSKDFNKLGKRPGL